MAKCKKCGKELREYEKGYCDSCWEDLGSEPLLAKRRRMVRKRKEPKEVGPLAGALLIVGVISLGFFGMMFISGGLYSAIMGLRTEWDLTLAFITLGIMVVALGIAMGLFIEKQGWLIGFLFAFIVMFIVVPFICYGLWGFYLWTEGGNYNEAWIYVPIVLGGGLIMGLLGSAIGKKYKLTRFSLKKPLFSFLPPVALCVVVALAIPILYPVITAEPSEVLKYPEWGFEVTKPRGWWSIEKGYSRLNDIYRLSLGESDATKQLSSAEISIYDEIPSERDGEDDSPWSEKDIGDFNSREECYQYITKMHEKNVAENPDDYASVDWSELTVDSVPAIRRASSNDLKDHNPYDCAVYVFKKPYLYIIWFYFDSDRDDIEVIRKDYNEILDSFKFL